MMSVSQHIVYGQSGYGKLFLKTTSTDADFKLSRLYVPIGTQYTYVDNSTGNIIQGSTQSNTNNCQADLSLFSGDTSLYLDVEDDVACLYFLIWSDARGVYYVDLDVLPNLSNFWLGNSHNANVLIKNDNGFNLLKNSYFYGMKFDNVDFIINNTHYEVLRIYGNQHNDYILNLVNKPLLNYIYLDDYLLQLTNTDFSNQPVKNASLRLKNSNILNYEYKFNLEILETLNLAYHSCNYTIGVNHPKLKKININKTKDNTSINVTDLLSNTPILEELELKGLDVNVDDDVIINHSILNKLYLQQLSITSLAILNTPNLDFLYLRYLTLTSFSMDTVSQEKINEVNINYSEFDELDLSSTLVLETLNVQLSRVRKINLKNGHNDRLTTFLHHTQYIDCCFLIDDVNNPPPAFANAQFRDGDVITDDQSVYDNF